MISRIRRFFSQLDSQQAITLPVLKIVKDKGNTILLAPMGNILAFLVVDFIGLTDWKTHRPAISRTIVSRGG